MADARDDFKRARARHLSEAFRSPVARPLRPLGKRASTSPSRTSRLRVRRRRRWLLLTGVVFEVMRHAKTAIADYGFGFPDHLSVGRQPRAIRHLGRRVIGTLYTSLLALGIGGFLGRYGCAWCLSQGFVPRRVELVMKSIIEPARGHSERRLRLLGHLRARARGAWSIRAGSTSTSAEPSSVFSTRLGGPGIFPAALVLSIMILPTVTAVSREAMAAVPKRLAAAAYGLGATRWEMIFQSHPADGDRRHLRGAGAWLWPRARRDDGARDVGRECQRLRLVTLLAGQYVGCAARQSFPGGGQGRGRRVDVRSGRTDADHARGERAWARCIMLRATRELKGLG